MTRNLHFSCRDWDDNPRSYDIRFYLGSAVVGLLAGLAMIALVARSADGAEHPDFSGTWKLNASASRIKDSKLTAECSKVTISQKEPSISLAEADAPAVECTTSGKDCATKASKVSFWFNGAKLVEMESQGHTGHVRKRRLSLSPDGKSLQMEVIPITPAGESSLLAFDKAQ
jgi:hypothetical protein